MILPGRLGITALLLLSLTPVPVAAQSASVLLAEGIRAYRDLEFAAAAQLLRRALEPADARGLSSADRLSAFVYLGAALIFREERDQAVATFRTLVLTDPRFRPDSLVFPPRVTQVFDDVLQTTKAIALAAPREARLRAGDEWFTVRAYATSRHHVEARILSGQGLTVATLYRGLVLDSTVLAWNGLDSTGNPVPEGRYAVVVASSLTPDQILRSVRLPLDVSTPKVDTLPWPAEPEAGRAGWKLRFLVPGAVLGVGLAVPAALGAGGAKGPRIALGIAFGTAGLVAGRPRTTAPSPAAQADWRTSVERARQENARRRARAEIVVRTGPAEFREGPSL